MSAAYGETVDFDVRTYGKSFADVYDAWYADVSDVEGTVTALVALADGGPVLELGVGSGRLATPLARRGVTVVGVDASQLMLDRVDPSSPLVAVVGDMASLPFRRDAGFSLVFVAFNTLFNVASRDGQQRCIEATAAVLRPGGVFAVEAFVPDVEPDIRPDPDTRVGPSAVAAEHPVLTSSVVDRDHQLITGAHVEMLPGGHVRRRPWQLRYATPDQIDDMAAEAGLSREHRYSDWVGTPFDESSIGHVSLYRRL